MARVTAAVWNTFQFDSRVLKEAQTLARHGHEVTVVALHRPGETASREVLEDRLRVVRVRKLLGDTGIIARLRRRRAARGNGAAVPREGRVGVGRKLMIVGARVPVMLAIAARIVHSRPDVVHAHDAHMLAICWLAARIARARLIYDAHEIRIDRHGKFNLLGLIGWTERRLMPRADACITTTEARARCFHQAYRVPLPMVLQNRPRYSEPVRTRRIAEELGLGDDLPIVLYQGGMQPGRGLERTLRLLPDLPPCHLVYIGGGKLAPALRDLARTLGLEDRAHFIPTVPLAELPSYTASADIGLQPLRNTCLNHVTTDSNKLFEYCMAGLPVAASDFPEIRRIIEDHGFGVLFDPDDPRSVARALGPLIRDPDLRARLGARALAARAELCWEGQETRLVELYRRVEAGERPASVSERPFLPRT